MADNYRNTKGRTSIRASWWDYGRAGAYFVTICTANHECYFGDIKAGKMVLSEIGEIARSEWLKTPEMRPDMNLRLDEYAVMPNHFHGIIVIGENQYNRDIEPPYSRDAMHCVSTADYQKSRPGNQFIPQSKNLASIIRGFKIGVTRNARLINTGFVWQPRFHDHIIRNEIEYLYIENYIANNPANWRGE